MEETASKIEAWLKPAAGMVTLLNASVGVACKCANESEKG